jgi:hypothetical protein
MNSEFTVFNCSHVGVAGTTRVFVKKVGDQFVARVGIAIMGSTNMKEEELALANPFDSEFKDNFCEGTGASVDAAVESLKNDIRETSETLWL